MYWVGAQAAKHLQEKSYDHQPHWYMLIHSLRSQSRAQVGHEAGACKSNRTCNLLCNLKCKSQATVTRCAILTQAWIHPDVLPLLLSLQRSKSYRLYTMEVDLTSYNRHHLAGSGLGIAHICNKVADPLALLSNCQRYMHMPQESEEIICPADITSPKAALYACLFICIDKHPGKIMFM